MINNKETILKATCILIIFSLLSLFFCYSVTSLDTECKKHVLKINKPYSVKGKTYYPRYQPGYREIGLASWYGREFYGNKTASGEIYRGDKLTAAHKTLPLHSIVKVTNISNGKHVIVRINDRGPFSDERIIDLSRRAADKLDIINSGLVKVRVSYIGMSYKNVENYCSKNEISDILGKREIKRKNTIDVQKEDYVSNNEKVTSIHLNENSNELHSEKEFERVYYVQVGAYRNKSNAENTLNRFLSRQQLNNKDLSIVYISPFYKVRIGPYDLFKARSFLDLSFNEDYFIVKE